MSVNISVLFVCLVFHVKMSYFEIISSEELSVYHEDTDSSEHLDFKQQHSVPRSDRREILNKLIFRSGSRHILRDSTNVIFADGSKVLVGNGVSMPLSNATRIIVSNGTRTIVGSEMWDGFNTTETKFNLTGEDYEVEPVNITYYNNLLNETWLNLISVMDLFTQREYDNISSIQALTAAYRYTMKQQKRLRMQAGYLKKPFIVIEGLDREKRDALATRLSVRLQGHVVPNPPDTFEVVLKHLPANCSKVKNGFYVLSTYVAALHVRYVVQKTPAVVPGYWLGRAAFSIAKNFEDDPPPYESKFWVWPKDLVKPDIVFYLTDRFSLHQFEDHRFVERYLHVFDNWIDPRCIPIYNTVSIEAMMEEIEPSLQKIRSVQ